MDVIPTPRFDRAYRRYVGVDVEREHKEIEALGRLAVNPTDPVLKAHKLTGELVGLWSCSCGYDGRIVYALRANRRTGQKCVELLDVGTHEEVY